MPWNQPPLLLCGTGLLCSGFCPTPAIGCLCRSAHTVTGVSFLGFCPWETRSGSRKDTWFLFLLPISSSSPVLGPPSLLLQPNGVQDLQVPGCGPPLQGASNRQWQVGGSHGAWALPRGREGQRHAWRFVWMISILIGTLESSHHSLNFLDEEFGFILLARGSHRRLVGRKGHRLTYNFRRSLTAMWRPDCKIRRVEGADQLEGDCSRPGRRWHGLML